MFRRFALAVLIMVACCPAMSVAQDSQAVVPLPSPLIQDFDLWGTLSPDSQLTFYSGWANGLLTTTKDSGALALRGCLEKMTFKQILLMIDKRYADHHEAFHNPIGTEMIQALTVAGSPCEGIKVGN